MKRLHGPRLSRPLWAASSAVLVLGLAFTGMAQEPLSPADSPAISLTGWQYRWGDSPVNDRGLLEWPADTTDVGWGSTPEALNPPGRGGHHHLWIRRQLPDGPWRDPVLYVPPTVLSYEVYLDGALLLQTGDPGQEVGDKASAILRHFVPLPPDYRGKMLAIRIYSDLGSYIGPTEDLRIGYSADVLRDVLLDDLSSVILGVLLVALGLFSFALFIFGRGRHHPEYLSFGVFTLCTGIGPLALSPLFEWMTPAATVRYYLGFASFFLFPVGMFAFLEQVITPGPWRIMRRVWQFHLGFALVAIVLDVTNVVLLPSLQLVLMGILAVDVMVTILVVAREAARGNMEARVMIAGAMVLALTGLNDILVSFGVIPEWFYLFQPGTFAFALLLGYVLERRFDQNQRRLLERTEHLAEANQDLNAEIEERRKAEEALRSANDEIRTLRDRLAAENTYLQEEIRTEHNFQEIVSQSPAFKAVLRNVERVASTDATVLVLGETGTGKELLVRAIHGISRRRDRPLVKLNCAALPPDLVESELFGHERGAFTGAHARKVGRFELAHGGTIFLDEIGDLPLELQAKLLRVLQEGEIERLGGTQTIRVDVRVIAATNRKLEEAIARGQFREDLYYRLNVFPIRLPPLRERKEDIPLLVRHFVDKYAVRIGKEIRRISQGTIDTLTAYDWPGNIRELENIVERAVVVSRGDTLELLDWLPTRSAGPTGIAPEEPRTLEEVERAHIQAVLEQTGWRVSGPRGAAEILGLKRTTLESRMKKLRIERPQGP